MMYRFDEDERFAWSRYPQGRGARAFSALHPTRCIPRWICAPLDFRGGSEPSKDRGEPHDGRDLPSMKIPMGELTSLAL
jgi:hypothetical protein